MRMIGSRWPLMVKKRVDPSGKTVSKPSTMRHSSKTTWLRSSTRSLAAAISGTSAKSPSTMRAPAMPLAIWMSAPPWWWG